MAGRRILAALALAAGLLPSGEGATVAQGHPRLFFTADAIPVLRARIARAPWAAMAARLRADADLDNWGRGPADPANAFDQLIVGTRHAFLYVLSGDDAHAQRARAIAAATIADPRQWAGRGIKGLTLYAAGSRVAMMLDWCAGAPSWDAAFAAEVAAALRAQGTLILRHGGSEQNTSPASNWQGARFAAGGLCLLAADPAPDPALIDLADRRCAEYLRANLGTAAESRGWNSEGLGYTFYPMGNVVVPYAIARVRQDPRRDLRRACAGAAVALWTVHAAIAPYADRTARPDFADDNPGTAGEGTFAQAFWWSPEALQPGLAWSYDRLAGSRGDGRHDPARAGTIWGILLHPGDAVAERDPLTIPAWTRGFDDTGGLGLFTWRSSAAMDGSDVVTQLMARLREPGGHSGPDGLGLRIIGLRGAFAVGGGRYGIKTGGQHVYLRSQTTVYPGDPDGPLAIRRGTGRVLAVLPRDPRGGGGVVAAMAHSTTGVREHVRRLAVDHGASGASAAWIVADTSADGRVWQLCVPADHRVDLAADAFTVTAPSGASLLARIVHAAGGPRLRSGTRARGSGGYGEPADNRFVLVHSDDGAFALAMTLQPAGAAHPALTASGAFGPRPQAELRLGAWRVAVDGDQMMVR